MRSRRKFPALFQGGAGWTPASIPGLRLWLKADTGIYTDAAGTTPAVSDGSPTGLWKDQSSSACDVSQDTASKKPLLKLGANGINGRPVILFDGVDDLLRRSVADWLGGDSAGSVFVVARLSSAFNSVSMLLSSADEVSAGMYSHYCYMYINGSSQNVWRFNQRNNDTADSLDGNTVLTANNPYLLAYLSSGSAYGGRVNGADQTLAVASGANAGDWYADTANRDNLVVGARVVSGSEGSFLKGAIAEILVYSSNLTGANLEKVEVYLNARYACY